MTVTILGLLLLAPVPPFVPSTALFAAAAALVGLGIGILSPSTPSFMLRILERDAGLHRRDVGGAIGSVVFFVMMLSALLGPPIGRSRLT
jgi:MFS family permease